MSGGRRLLVGSVATASPNSFCDSGVPPGRISLCPYAADCSVAHLEQAPSSPAAASRSICCPAWASISPPSPGRCCLAAARESWRCVARSPLRRRCGEVRPRTRRGFYDCEELKFSAGRRLSTARGRSKCVSKRRCGDVVEAWDPFVRRELSMQGCASAKPKLSNLPSLSRTRLARPYSEQPPL